MKVAPQLWRRIGILVALVILAGVLAPAAAAAPIAHMMIQGGDAGILPGWIGWLILGLSLLLSLVGWVWYRQK